MDFVSLSKIAPVLVYPLFLVLWSLVFAAALLYRGRVRGAGASIVIAIAILVVCGNPSFSNAVYASHERTHLPRPIADYPEVDVIIVLGGSLDLPLPPREYADLGAAADRPLHGARLYRAGKADAVLLSGGNVFPQAGFAAESHYTARLMNEWGVPDSALLVEGRSRNTYENAVYSKALMSERGFRSALLVTSALHMPRALAVFRTAGVDVVAAPTDYKIVEHDQPSLLNWLPNLRAMGAITEVVRERLGIAVYRHRGWISDEAWSARD
jgi:uncharacterized SAM-binding protein YcdF (DUF218 family)